MQVTLLGTGTSGGIPLIGCPCAVCASDNPKDKRLRTAALIEVNNLTIAIDCGPDFRQQMLAHNVRHLDAILFTHAHRDHTAGLDDIRAYNLWQKKPMPIYATHEVQQILKVQFNYAFEENKYEGAPNIALHTIEQQPFTILNQLQVTPIYVVHGNAPVVGFRIGNFTYITDASYITPQEQQKITGTKTMVLNALRHTQHWSHFNLSQALQHIQQWQIPQAYLTHISHQMGLHHEVEANHLPPNVRLGYDGLQFTVD